MTVLAAVMPPRLHPRVMTVAQWVGLGVGAWILWQGEIGPKLSVQKPLALVGEALADVGIVWLCGSVVMFHIFAATSFDNLSKLRRTACLSAVNAVWLAPAFLLLSSFTPIAVALGLALIANTARVVMSMALGSESLRLPQFPVRNKPVLNLLELPAVFLSWSGTPPLVAALAAQASAVALWKGYPLAAAMFLGASAAALTAFAIATGAYEPRPDQDPPRTLWSLLASLLLAATFSTAGLQLSLNLQPNDGGWMSGTRHAIGRLFHGAPAVETKPADQPEPEVTPVYIPAAPAGRSLSDGEYSGLVLREKDKPQTVKMMSLPLRSGLFRLTRPSNVIPFTGVYWLFRPPARQPPLSATIRNGSPIDSRFMTTDGAPIELEAHQRLNPPVDVASCRRIQVTVRDSERGPVPLYAHMKLYDRSDGQVQDLGLTDASIGASHRSVIEFALPASPFLRRFNEIEVAFYLAFFNNSRSARVQVESFTLLSY